MRMNVGYLQNEDEDGGDEDISYSGARQSLVKARHCGAIKRSEVRQWCFLLSGCSAVSEKTQDG